jgi:hypothetical protein
LVCFLTAFDGKEPNEFEIRLAQAKADMPRPSDFSFLSELEMPDFYFLAPQIFPVYQIGWAAARARPFRKFFLRQTTVSGALGELYLTTFLRRWIQMNPKSEFIDGPTYATFNEDGKKPDGLVVRKTPQGVVVEKILEAKMGNYFDPSQLHGILRVWQIKGLHLPDGTQVPPDKIQILVERTEVPLRSLDLGQLTVLKEMEKVVWLFTSNAYTRNFAGEVHKTPFSSEELAIFSKRFLAYAWLGPLGNSQKVSEVLQTQRSLPQYWRKSAPFAEPVLTRSNKRKPLQTRLIPRTIFFPKEPDLLPSQAVEKPPPVVSPPKFSPGDNPLNDPENRKKQLNKFVKEAGKFPIRSTSKGLADFMQKYGGQMAAFAEVLDDDARQILIQKGNFPAISPMEHWLSKVDLEKDPLTAEKMMAVYLTAYGDTGFIEKLKKNNPAWSQILGSESLATWKKHFCADHMSSLARPETPP